MKRNLLKTALTLGLTAIMLLSTATAAMASETAAPTVERTKAWDSIKNTLGGMPENVRKIEYAGSVFYLREDVTDADFLTVIESGPESVQLKPKIENGMLYRHPVYILWNSDRSVLLVHPIMFSYEMAIDGVSIPAVPPASLTGSITEDTPPQMSWSEEQEYMLTEEYAEAVRKEFYRLLNEHRAAHGLRELEVNLELQDYADIRAAEQSISSGHTRPNGSQAGSGWHDSKNNLNTRYAENALGVGTIDADPVNTALGIFSIWKDSEGHNQHMLYSFKPNITMAFGIAPKLDENGRAISGAIFATGY